MFTHLWLFLYFYYNRNYFLGEWTAEVRMNLEKVCTMQLSISISLYVMLFITKVTFIVWWIELYYIYKKISFLPTTEPWIRYRYNKFPFSSPSYFSCNMLVIWKWCVVLYIQLHSEPLAINVYAHCGVMFRHLQFWRNVINSFNNVNFIILVRCAQQIGTYEASSFRLQ